MDIAIRLVILAFSLLFSLIKFLVSTLLFLRDTHRAHQASKPKLLTFTQEERFEHMHVVAGSGHGKTQMLQTLLLTDLPLVEQGKASVIVIDSQGDLINNILHLSLMAELAKANRLVIIDPNDIEHPPALNLFDFGLAEKKDLTPLQKEKLLNSAVSLYTYLFGALLETELTGRQEMLFQYLARLMLVVPGANIHTLIEFVENPETIKPYLKYLDPLHRQFLETKFPSPQFDATRAQITARLYAVLANGVLYRMFSHERNMVNIGQAMNTGSLILINTAKSLLKQDGCELFGRFFIALILQATQERDIIPFEKRLPTFLYIDEAHDYFENDENIRFMLEQARKYRVGLTLAHQTLGQLKPGLAKTINANTSIKLAGGVTGEDARFFASEMQCDPSIFAEVKKDARETRFAFKRRNDPEATILHIAFGEMESMPKLTNAEYQKILEVNRKRVSLPRLTEPVWLTPPQQLGQPDVI